MFNRLFCTLILFLFISPGIFGQNPGAYTHDGFFMRFLLGGSYSTMSMDGVSPSLEISGMSGAFRFQIGSEIGTNLVAFGELGGVTIQNPDFKIGGSTYETEDVQASTIDFGGGLTYYFMPDNIYLTGSILASKVSMEFKNNSATSTSESDMGFGVFVGAGKEWWVSDDWALGATVFMAYSKAPDKGSSDITIATTTFGVAFSATFQ